jgi:hypothetical protein
MQLLTQPSLVSQAMFADRHWTVYSAPFVFEVPMACGPKEYTAHAEACLRRAQTVRNPILAEEFEKLAQSWRRLAKAAEREASVVQLRSKKWDAYSA